MIDTAAFRHNLSRVRELARSGIRRTEPERIQDFRTLPALLGEAGYATYQAGKFWEGDHALAGFSAGLQAEGAGMANVGSQGRFIGRSLPLDPVSEFVDAQAGRPFFLFFTPMLPHTPHDALEFRPALRGAGPHAPLGLVLRQHQQVRRGRR